MHLWEDKPYIGTASPSPNSEPRTGEQWTAVTLTSGMAAFAILGTLAVLAGWAPAKRVLPTGLMVITALAMCEAGRMCLEREYAALAARLKRLENGRRDPTV